VRYFTSAFIVRSECLRELKSLQSEFDLDLSNRGTLSSERRWYYANGLQSALDKGNESWLATITAFPNAPLVEQFLVDKKDK